MEIARRAVGGVRTGLARYFKWEYAWLLIIVLATLALHFVIIARPNGPLFDEIYYVKDAHVILQQHTTERTEHPPLAKLIIAGGTIVFGDNQYGWRIPAVVFGTAGIVFLYLICRRLNLSRRTATLGAFLFATENLTFVMSSVALLDIFMVTLMLAAFWLYLRGNYALSGVGVALSTLAKFTGVFGIIAIILHWLIKRRDRPVAFVGSLLVALASFVGLFVAFEAAIYHKLVDPVYWLRYALGQTASLTFVTASHPSMSRPWNWVLLPEIMPFWYHPHYIALVSFTIWAMIVPVLVLATIKALKRRDDASVFVLAWFIGTYGIWIPYSLLTNRISFIYYFLPAVGGIVMGVAIGLDRLINIWQGKEMLAGNQALPLPQEGPPAIAAAEASPLPQPPQPPSAVPGIQTQPAKRPRKAKLQWAALSFVIFFLLLHVAIFVIVAPPLNDLSLENWFH